MYIYYVICKNWQRLKNGARDRWTTRLSLAHPLISHHHLARMFANLVSLPASRLSGKNLKMILHFFRSGA